jgi:excisionase family DNA binding protein
MTELQEVRSELGELRKLVERLLSRGEERPRNYKYKEAARLIGVHPKTVSRMVASGQLLPIRVRGKSLIPLEEIDRVSRPPQMKSSGATEARTRYDGAAALKKLKDLRKRR